MSIDMNKVLTYVESQGKAIAEDRQNAAQIRANSVDAGTWETAGSYQKKLQNAADDTPFYKKILDRLTVKDSNERSWLNKGLLEDGVDEGDVWKTILASFTDAEEDLLTGAGGIFEGVTDAAAMTAPIILGTDRDKVTEFVEQDLIDEQKTARSAISATKGVMKILGPLLRTAVTHSKEDLPSGKEALAAALEQYAYMDQRMEDESVLGEKLDSLAQSTGQMAATSALQSVGVPWWLVTGATAAGGEAENAIKEGATYEQALDSAIISGASEVVFEKLSGAVKFGGKALDEAAVTALSRSVSNKLLRNAAKFGMDVVGEGAEEVATSLASNFGQWLTYRSDEELSEIFASEQAVDELIEAFFSGALMGGGSNVTNAVTSKAAGVDATTGLTANEEKVVNKLYKDRLAEAEKDGKVTAKQKNKIYDEVVEAMDKGEISTDDIEDVVGGDSYREYKKAMENQEDNAFLREYDELGSKRGATPKENAQYSEMTERAKQINENRKNLRSRLSQEVSEMVKGDRLSESYRQKALRGVAFKADLTKVDEKQRAIYQKAIDSGVVNDTRRSHEFVDLVAKIAADKGVDFDFTNNERLKQSGFVVEGATVNGYVNEDGVTINMQSAKALNKVVGHEVTHVLEGTDLYDALQKVAFDFAEAKGELVERWKATKALYKDLDSQEINKEITADLVGDYLFGDSDFIGQLYAGHRSTFEKIYDEIKYLCKVVTAGSKEARQLEKVKKAFADAYRMGEKPSIERTKYSLYDRPKFNSAEWSIVNRRKHSEFDNPKYDLDSDRKWMYAEEKGSTVFAIYSKHDADDPTVLYGSRGKQAERDYSKVSQFTEGGSNHVNRGRTTLDRLLTDIESKKRNGSIGITDTSRGRSAARDVPLPLQESGRNGQADYGYGGEDLQAEGLTENDTGATEVPVAPVTFSNDYQTIRNFMKDDSDIGPVKYSLSSEDSNSNGVALDNLTFEDIDNMSDEQLERAIRDLGYDISMDIPDDIWLDEDLDLDDISEELEVEPEVVQILYRRKGLGDSYVAENKTAVMTTKRIDQRIAEHGAGMTDYARRYITRISPKDFIDMTVYKKNMDREKFDTRVRGDLDGKMGDWDYEQQLKDSEEPPVLIIDKSTGQIIGHNGRHRMRALEMAGIESVEIEIELHDEDGYIIKYNSQTIPDLAVSSQFDTAIETHLPNVIPFNKVHRNEILHSYGENAHTDAGVKYSLSPEGIAPVYRGNHNIVSEEVYFDASAVSQTTENADVSEQTEPVRKADGSANLSPKDRANKFFFDEVMSLDKMPESFRKKHGEKWVAIQRATENAQNLVVHGTDGVKPLNDIFQRVVDTGAFAEFERYMQHQLNMDAMSLNQRFGLKNKDVIGGVTAEMSRQEAATLEKAHPEFKELAQEIYEYNRFLRNVLVQSGKITQETADLWERRYPHYIPIKRAGFGNDFEVSELLDFMIENMEQVPDAENMDGFFQRVEDTAPVKARKGSDLPIQPLFDTLTERAMQTYWAAAMNDADMRAFAPVRSDVSTPIQERPAPTATKTVVPENVKMETEKSSDPKILDVENDVMRKGKMNPIKWVEEFLLDNGMVFERLAKKTKDRVLEAKWNFVRNARGAAQHLIGNGDQAKGVKALKDLFAEVKKTGAVEQFYEYLGHQRNLDGMTMRVRFGIPVNQMMMGRSAAESVDAIFKMNEEHPEFQALAEATYKYSDNLLTMMVENGMIAQSDADMIREISPHWIPFNTVEGKIQPVFTTLAQETLKVQHQMSLNKFGIHLKNTLGTVVSENPMNMREFMNSIEKSGNLVHFGGNARFHTMTVLENGKAVTFEITDEMYTALKPTRDILSTSLPVLSQASTLRRNLITAYSLWFTAKNAIRDIQEVVVNSQHPLKTYATIPQAIKEIRQKGTFYQEYVKNGGEQNTYFDTESGEFGSGKGIMNALETKTGLSRILKANNFVEMVPRFAEYIASREAGVSVEVAMLDAARVTTNFAAGGKVTKFLNRNGATFLNASVQGALQQARNFAEAKQNGFKGWASLAARYAALGLPVVLLNNLIWDDDEDYQKLPDYITNNYYIVWKYGESSFVRLPKGRTAAVIQNAIKQVSADKADWKEFWNVLGENLAPNNPLEDNIFAPVIQVGLNKTWYDEDLVPQRLQKLDDVTQRFDEKTSRWAVKLSKKIEDSWLGDHVDWSPKQIHYLLDQYSGVLGDTILPFTTPKAESPTDAGNLIAPVRDIFTTNSVLNDRVTGDFYETLEAVQSEAETPGSSRSVKLQNEILSNYNFRINELLQQQRDIQNSDLKDSEKYKQNLELKKQINALQEEALAQYQNIRITGKYAEAADKRYNYSFNKNTGLNEWFEIRPKDADGSDNWFYQMEQGATKAFGISPAEYWNNQEEYAAAYWAAKHYDDSYFETVKNVLGIDDFARYADGMTKIYADKDKNGNSISGSKKRKMKDYVYGLNIPEIEKHILFKAEYNKNKQHDHEIRKYLESLDLSASELSDVLKELGMN